MANLAPTTAQERCVWKAQCDEALAASAPKQNLLAYLARIVTPRLLRDVDRLKAIVDKLLKTADGVSMVPGMIVYDNSGPVVVKARVTHISEYFAECVVLDENDEATEDRFSTSGSVYSTREAAEAAAKESSGE